MTTTIDDITNLGYETGIASGSVDAAPDALAAATDDAHPTVIGQQTVQVVSETVRAMDDDGKLPTDEAGRRDMISQITESVLVALTQRADARIEFHELALANAQEMPNLWHVKGWGNELYVNCKEDGTGWDTDAQDLLDALLDPGSHSERVWQHENPEAMAAVTQLASNGYVVARPKLGVDAFVVDGKKLDAAGIITFAEAAVPKLSQVARIADAIANDPAISAETKNAIVAALAD